MRAGPLPTREDDVEPHRQRRRRDTGGLIFGGILLLVGIYYLLQQTLGFDLPDLDWDQLWPILLIILGGGILWSAWSRRREP
jgi:LiaI-LiaF-like transmembrane region